MSSKTAHFARVLPAAVFLLVTLACSGSPFAPPETPASRLAKEQAAAPPQGAEAFSVERAWAHLVALSDLGPRPSQSDANREAFEYIRSRLEELDVEVIDIEYTAPIAQGAESDEAATGEKVLMHHLTARIPGESPDSIMLAAHFDTYDRSTGANEGASGPAVLLELARQLVERPLPYTVELLFLDGDMGYYGEEPEQPLYEASRMMVGYLGQANTLDVVRLAVVYGQVGDADLTISRDLHSSRFDRETFFDVAEELGFGESFPRDRGYVETQAGHRAFLSAGMPRIVLLHDPWYGGDEMPGEYYGGEHDVRDHCAPQSLHTVGTVSLSALRVVAARLEKIDRLSGRAARRKAEASERAELISEPVEEPIMAEEEAAGEPVDVLFDVLDAEPEPGPDGAESDPGGPDSELAP
ncbi:MAG: M28 family peptidase [Deltaproteobacteria bacterium]|nr:M28 family peptidase [Deltaproteobacteria bacterium]MBW2448066.1 M28 family peptidase [Deltaproteobacteria bacterium]